MSNLKKAELLQNLERMGNVPALYQENGQNLPVWNPEKKDKARRGKETAEPWEVVEMIK